MNKSIDVSLRLAEARDAEAIISLLSYMDEVTPYLMVEPVTSVSHQVEILNAYVQSPTSIYLVALIDDKLIGVATIAGENHPKQMHRGIVGVVVHDDYWNLGIGRLLLNEVLTFANQSSLSILTLEVIKQNIHAIQLYESVGFKQVGTIHDYIRTEDESYDAYMMELILK